MLGFMTLNSLKQQEIKLKRHTLTVYFIARDPKTPWLVKILAILIAAYALSPIDLIPDFIPVIGYLDDLIIVPLGLLLVIRLTPKQVIESAKQKADQSVTKPVSYLTGVIFVIIWLVILYFFVVWLGGCSW